MKQKGIPITKQQKLSVGILGLGIIGTRVAAILRREERIQVLVWNRSSRPEPHFLPSPLEVAASAEILQIFVRDGTALLEVVEQIVPALTKKHLVLNHATVSPQETLKAAALVEKKGAQFLDAPFTGSRDAAAEGKLVYYVGGSDEALERAIPILKLSSKKILPMGAIGTATYIKIATNLIAGVQIQVLAEALEFLNLGEIPFQYLHEALQHNAAFSNTIGMKLPLMLQGNFEPHFSTKNMLKDLQFALNLVEDHGIALPATAATAASLRDLVALGLGDKDYSALAARYDYQ
ncbi:MAG: NAD(P)-dependent oxidoreductase [Chthoniobacterales bacterium]